MSAGDWPGALAGYQAVLDQSSDPALVQAARLGIAQARFNSGDAAGAIDDLTAFLAANPSAPHAAEAQFLLGDAYRATSQWAPAIAAYQAFLKLRPGAIDSYAQASLAQAAVAEGDYPTAVDALKAAVPRRARATPMICSSSWPRCMPPRARSTTRWPPTTPSIRPPIRMRSRRP